MSACTTKPPREGEAFTDAQARALWRERCAEWIDMGFSIVHGSPEHMSLVEIRGQAREKAEARP